LTRSVGGPAPWAPSRTLRALQPHFNR